MLVLQVDVRSWHLWICGRHCNGLCSHNAQKAYFRSGCVRNRDWIASIIPCSVTLPMQAVSWFSGFRLDCKRPLCLSFAVVCGVEAFSIPFSALPAGLVGLLELAAERLAFLWSSASSKGVLDAGRVPTSVGW